MIAEIDWRAGRLRVDFARGRSLAIAMDPRGRNPSFFSASPVRARPLERGDFVGDMSTGASCNAEVIEFSAHSHGTHTECVGHIVPDRLTVAGTIDQRPTLMRLITVPGEALERGHLIPAEALGDIAAFDGGAVAVRTLPNEATKQWRDYDEAPGFPVLSGEAIRLLSASTLLHLLVDTPSLDGSDNPRLENHAVWWGLDASLTPGVPNPAMRSVTEMIYAADDIPDGDYWLELQLSPFVSDAVPSRPMVYPIERMKAAAE